MSSSAQDILIAGLNTARIQNNRYLTIIIFIIGVIGNLCNVLVFSHPTLNQVPTTRYFLAASGASLASLTSGLLGRIFSGWGADPASRNTSLCKFQAFTNKLGQTSCSYFILAAAIDRWLQSNRNIHYRQMSSIKNSTRIILLILIIFGIYHSIHAICFEAFLDAPPIKCYAGSIICRYYENLSYIFITILIPQFLMLGFGWKTIRNIHQTQQRVGIHATHQTEYNTQHSHSITMTRNNSHRAKMRSITRMLIIQVIAYIFLTIPAAADAFYMTLTLGGKVIDNTDLQLTIDRFVFAFTTVLSYMGVSLSFYLYTLTGPTFRQTLLKIILKPIYCQTRH